MATLTTASIDPVQELESTDLGLIVGGSFGIDLLGRANVQTVDIHFKDEVIKDTFVESSKDSTSESYDRE